MGVKNPRVWPAALGWALTLPLPNANAGALSPARHGRGHSDEGGGPRWAPPLHEEIMSQSRSLEVLPVHMHPTAALHGLLDSGGFTWLVFDRTCRHYYRHRYELSNIDISYPTSM